MTPDDCQPDTSTGIGWRQRLFGVRLLVVVALLCCLIGLFLMARPITRGDWTDPNALLGMLFLLAGAVLGIRHAHVQRLDRKDLAKTALGATVFVPVMFVIATIGLLALIMRNVD